MIQLTDPLVTLYEGISWDVYKKSLSFRSINFLDEYVTNWYINDDTGLIDCEMVDCSDRYGGFDIPIKFGECTGDFNCSNNSIVSLKNCPRVIGGNFDCSGNKLSSLLYGPAEVGGSYMCEFNPLKTLQFYPDIIKGDFWCRGTKIKDVREYVSLSKNVAGILNTDFGPFTTKDLSTIDFLNKSVEEL